jgi:7-cyano-7-deazaguanine synthase in queuosine biosynthesis
VEQLVWPAAQRDDGAVEADLDPWLTQLGTVSLPAIDLVRFGAAAYLADHRVPRPTTFSRSIDLHVHLLDPAPWTPEVLSDLADILSLLSGDRWSLNVVVDTTQGRHLGAAVDPAARVALLSGGLDSFCGAALGIDEQDRLFMGHWDNPTIKGSQDRVRSWFVRNGHPIRYRQVRLGVRLPRPETSKRTRSLLFMALATAAATATGASIVEVPENGYTSLNPPLGPERGGALSTRSTHPATLERFNSLVTALGLAVAVENPHTWRTKGELVALAAQQLPDFADGAAETMSCAKLDGGRYKGGNPNYHCGLCFACFVRRGSMAAAGVRDATPYLSGTLINDSRAKLLRNRQADVDAVVLALARGIDETDLMTVLAAAPQLDFDAALDLCRRGLQELGLVHFE